MVINTHVARRWQLWDDPLGIHDCAFAVPNSMGPLQVKRLRVFAWPVPCEQLPYGCETAHQAGSQQHLIRYGTPLVVDRRTGAKFGSGAWLRARYGTDATYWTSFGIKYGRRHWRYVRTQMPLTSFS